MSNDDIRSNKHLLFVASKNLKAASDALDQVSWPEGTAGLSSSISLLNLAVQQTINTVVKVLEDL